MQTNKLKPVFKKNPRFKSKALGDNVSNDIWEKLDNINTCINANADPDNTESSITKLSINNANSNDTDPLFVETAVNYTPDGTSKVYITKSGAFLTFDHFTNVDLIKRVKKYFTIVAIPLVGPPYHKKCYTIDQKNKRIIVPRFGLFEILSEKYGLNTVDKTLSSSMQIKPGDKPTMPFVWGGKQTDNQKIIADHIMSNHYSDARKACGSAGVILNLEAGQGKSYLAAYLIYKLQVKTVIILHTTALIEQWVKVLVNVFGPNVSIGYYYAKKKRDGDIVIQIIDSSANHTMLLNGKEVNTIDYYNRFGFAIYDECHIYSHKTGQQALKYAQTPYMLGLSATPDENVNGFDKAVWWNIGPVLDAKTLPGYSATSEEFKAVVHRVMYQGPPSHTKVLINEATGLVSVSQTVNMLCDDYMRNMLVIDCILQSLKLGLFTYVFADRREYLLILRKMLIISLQKNKNNNTNTNVDLDADVDLDAVTAAAVHTPNLKIDPELESKIEICDNEADFMRIVGGAENAELENAETKAKVIFTTYQFMGTGKSIIKMNGLILANPRRSKMRQYINRIFRLGSDANIERHIWDICDMKVKVASQWHERAKYYNEKNYDIISEKVTYEKYKNAAGEYISQYGKTSLINTLADVSSTVTDVDADVDADDKSETATKTTKTTKTTKSETAKTTKTTKTEIAKSTKATTTVDTADTSNTNVELDDKKISKTVSKMLAILRK